MVEATIDLHQLVERASSDHAAGLTTILRANPVVAFPDEPLRVIAHRMAETGLTHFPVVERGSRRLVGVITLDDLLEGRARNLEAERRRERVMRVRIGVPFGLGRSG